MGVRRARRRSPEKKGKPASSSDRVESAPLEPIRVVERELTRPDGTKLRVKVPVYPPFQLPERPAPKVESRKPPAKKKAS